MSEWVKIRDAALKNLEVENVTEEAKQNLSRWLVETLLPVADVAADKFISQTVEQAKQEHGWTKARDLIILPAVIRGGLWLAKTTLSKTVK